jgi:micrococcal nuclease
MGSIRFSHILVILCLMVPWPMDALGDGTIGKVRWVFDGDTVVLTDGRTIRYIGIDAPEMDRDGEPAQLFAREALSLNREMAQGRSVRLEFDNQRRDRYQRTLAHLFLADGTMPARVLLRAGLARCLPKPPNRTYTDAFLQIQRNAMDQGRGQWHDWQEPVGTFLGNRRTLRVHRGGCPFGRRIRVRNRIEFSSLWQAFYAGYAPCKACMNTVR